MTKVSTSTASKCSLDFKQKLWAVLAAVAMVIALLPVFAVSTAFADDPIHSPGQELGEKHAVSGRVFLDRSGSRSYMEPEDKQGASDGDIGLGGAKVYAQWTDYNNRRQKGALSPVYYSQARPDGTYVIQLPDWTDSFGTVHKWEATLGQTLRIWADNPDSSKYTLAFVEGDSTFGGQGDRYRGTWNGVIGFNLAENYNIAFQERPQFDQMFPAENTWKQSSRKGGGGDVTGQVWYEERQSKGNSEAVPTFNAGFGEVKVPGVKVVGAYVQDEVARRFDQWKKAHKNYKRDEFKAAQREIMKAYEAETGKSAIAETVYDTTDAEGKYHLQFQGLWGNSYSAKGIMNAGTWGELVPEGANASWAKANLRSRHVNTEYMYVAPELPNGVGGSLNNFRDNMYQDGLNWTPNATTGSISNVENVNFALRIEGRDFHIETYDQTTNPAKPGDTVPTKATGFVPNNTYDIVWTDGDGNEVKTCTTQASNLGVVESCDFTVPANLAKDEIYIASIYPGGFDKPVRDRAMAKDSFAAKVTPEYKTTTIDLDGTATVATPNNKENNTTPPADTTYSAAAAGDVPASLLEGVDQSKVTVGAQAWAKVNSDGTISLNPKKGSVTPGSYLIPVKMTYGSGKDAYERIILAPVTVQDANADSDGDGVADAADKCAGTPVGAKVDADGCAVVLVVGDFAVKGMVGKAISPVSVKVTNDGKASDLSCSADELTAVGLTVKFDAASSACVISGTPTKSIDKQVDLTVGFKRADGAKDAGTVKKSGSVFVAKDDDGDGVADPKDPGNPVAGEDKCPGTPKGAKVDNDGCSVLPTVGKINPIVGEKDTPITSVTVPVDNPGKSKLTACKAEGLPAGLTIALNKEGTACVISGIPTEIVNPGRDVNVTVSFEPADKSADHPGGDIQGKTSVTIKDNLTDADRYNPAYPAVTGKPGESVKASQTGDKNVPNTARYVLGDNAPQGASVDDKTGQVTLNIPDTAKNGEEITVPVKVNYADNSADNATVTVKVRTDKDGDGKPDPVDPENPQAGDDLCPGTPAADKDKVDEFGCTLADRWNPSYADVNGQVGKPAVSAAPLFDEVTTKDKDEKTAAPAGTKFALGKDAPAGVSIDAKTGIITWDKPAQGNTEIPVKVTYKDGTTDKVTAKFKIALPGDDDGDGVADDKDKCAGTPQDAKVDKNGCSVAPSLPDAPKITGEKGKAIDPVDVPVKNPGKTKVTACQATGLPAGLTIEWNEGKQACVISGTPTEEVTDGKVTITVDYTPQDKTDQHPGGKASGETTVTITDPAKDGDGDGVADKQDKCAYTPKGAAVDKNGCALAPSVPVIPNIEGQKDKPLTPVVVPVDNPGKATITSCKAERLPKGLNIKWDEKRSACVISGTPTEIVTGQKVTISIDYTAPDGGKKPGSTQVETMVTIKSANPGPKDVVPGSGLPKTGAPILGLSLLALALTIAGMGTLTARRRQS